MKYLCLGYFSPSKMEALTKPQLSAIMGECRPHMEKFYGSGHVLMDAGLDLAAKSMRRQNGHVTVSDGSLSQSNAMIGAAFLVDAKDMDEAIGIAALHPTTQVAAGEGLGWHIEIRPVHHFHSSDPQTGNAR